MSNSKRIADEIYRDLYTLTNPEDVRGSSVNTVYPTTVIDQIFDDKDPTQKTLRELLAELHQEIITGGKGNIVFPVTSVNGQTGDVNITKKTIKLENVDNTADKDKPLSNPQRVAVENMLRTYDFKVNMDDLYDHISNQNNPHGVSLSQLDKDNELSNMIDRAVVQHSLATGQQVHPDIRSSLSKLWNYTEGINNTIEERVNSVLDDIADHYDNPLAHYDEFALKEDKANKVSSINIDITELDHTHYPSTRAVADYVKDAIANLSKYLPDLENWVDSITVIDDRLTLPAPSKKYYRKCYFIKYGDTSHDEIAICRKNEDDISYRWDITPLGSYSKFDQTYFTDTESGLSLRMDSIVNKIYNQKDYLQDTLDNTLEEYATKDYLKKNNYINDIKILPGTIDGTIRYQINNDINTMSTDIWVAGLKRLAFLEYADENDIESQSIHNRHIIDNAVDKRCVKDNSLDYTNLTCSFATIIGNMDDTEDRKASEISLIRLANELRPLINNEIDTSMGVGPTWEELINKLVLVPQYMTPNEEYKYNDDTYGMRFKGTISAIPNYPIEVVLSKDISTKDCKLIDAGGTWQYSTNPDEYTMLGGSNIYGNCQAAVNMTSTHLEFETISIGDRKDAEYDIWVKYTRKI